MFFSIENLRGLAFNDILTGSNGGTVVQAGLGHDSVVGGDGFDTLFGEGGNDTLFGGIGNDLLFGGDGNDVLFMLADTGRGAGDAGNDTINGSTGTDNLSGGSGTNTMIGGAASDSYFVISSTDVNVELATDIGPQDSVVAGVDYTLAAGGSVEQLLAFANTRSNTALTGNAFAQLIVGNLGDNILSTGGGAADTMFGNTGNDTFRVFNVADIVNEFAFQGFADRVQTAVSYALQATSEIEFLEAANAAGIIAINLVGNTLGQTLTGNAAANDLNGVAGASNILVGLGGDDFYRIFNSLDRVVEVAGQGANDRVAVAVSFALDKFSEIEVLSTLNAAGFAAINLIDNGFDQRVIGNAGDNVISGNGGNHTLIGGAGADTFLFFGDDGPDNIARINDYAVADDLIRFDATDASILPSGVLAANAFVINTTGLAQDAFDRIIYQTNTGKLFFDTDGAGGTAAVLFAQITPNLAMTVAEFDIFVAT